MSIFDEITQVGLYVPPTGPFGIGNHDDRADALFYALKCLPRIRWYHRAWRWLKNLFKHKGPAG
ncbi:hypothetical protein KGP36_01940 [Patescibacteria group bacterium]|nr:hypothetical protein [Patescibacteria group bacterium]